MWRPNIFAVYRAILPLCTVEVVRAASGGAALVCVDAVHLAPHRALDVRTLGCDILACSAYKGHSLMTLHVWIYTLFKKRNKEDLELTPLTSCLSSAARTPG